MLARSADERATRRSGARVAAGVVLAWGAVAGIGTAFLELGVAPGRDPAWDLPTRTLVGGLVGLALVVLPGLPVGMLVGRRLGPAAAAGTLGSRRLLAWAAIAAVSGAELFALELFAGDWLVAGMSPSTDATPIAWLPWFGLFALVYSPVGLIASIPALVTWRIAMRRRTGRGAPPGDASARIGDPA